MQQIFLEKLIVAQLLKFPAFVLEPESLLPCSQEPSIGPYTVPHESKP
jgi:hypothetical protein